ncbi:EamA-like transporter family-domain-containing protein [Flammula alnicola]|nr:EamA-like transporter family-domain-containing protein [Flammula alnicola]
MSSRNAYTALTPEFADFAIPHTPVLPNGPPSALQNGSVYEHEVEFASHDDEGGNGKIRTLLASAKGIIKNNTGLLLVAASQAFFSLMNVAVKKLNGIDPPVSTLELIAVRMGITYMCSITYMLWMGVPDPILGPKGVRLLLVFRGFIGFFGLFGIYYSLQYLSLSDATVLTFLAPMCTAIAGSLLLGENFTRKEALAGFISLVGVVLIARPTALFGNMHVPGDGISTPMESAEKGTPRDRLIAVGCVPVSSVDNCSNTSIRAIGKRAHPLHSLMFFSTLCVVVSTTGMIVTKAPFVVPTRMEWLALLAMIGPFDYGLQRETAGRGSMAVYTQVVFATILERIFFKAIPTALSVIGTLLIISSAIYVALTKEQEVPKASKSINLQRLPTDESDVEQGLLNAADATEEDVQEPPRHPLDPDKSGRHVHFAEQLHDTK